MRNPIHILYAAGQSMRQGGPVRLILLNKVWHVVARAYLCRVVDVEEGRHVIAGLTALRLRGESPKDLVQA
jgi:hypothetical protein